MLSKWVSDELDQGEPLDSECAYYNNTVKIEANGCSLFGISRSPVSLFTTSLERALRCASKTGVECVLSFEIGLAIPAAFVSSQTAPLGMLAIIAPKIEASADQKHVRVSVPPDGLFESKTMLMNTTLNTQYMDENKQMQSSILKDDAAFCVQLLRRAYDESCWRQLDE